ncbi:family 20 glycosylhydrolase [Streptomyces sp. MS2A]|nr:family 20 glycosylhydrolase [Streptomyces sp. MS2A]
MTAPLWHALPQPAAFTPSGGTWRPSGVRVVADDPRLGREAERLRGDLHAQGVPEGSASLVRLRIDPALAAGVERGAEAYLVEVGDDVVVRGASPSGVFRGTRQLLHNLRAQGGVPRGRAHGTPAVAERGLHLDAGRKHFGAEGILALLHDAADVGINVLQWHFSENEGFRLESAAFPEIVSAGRVTRAEAARILAVAADLHVEIVPSLDMPGHLRQVLSAHPELRLPPGIDGYGPDVPPPAITGTDHALDIARPETWDFARRLIDDMLPVFPDARRWNLGGDEFVDFARIDDHPGLAAAARERFGPDATGFDLLTAFVNHIAAHLRSRGLEPRAWNDGMLRGAVVSLDPSVVLTWWTNWNAGMRPLADAVAAGHGIVNVNDALFYYVLGENAGYRYPTAARIWEADWHPGLFPDLPAAVGEERRQELAAPYPPLLRGVSFAIWSDRPDAQTVDEVTAGIRSPLRAMAERAWNGGSRLSLTEFIALEAAIGEARASSEEAAAGRGDQADTTRPSDRA